MNEKQHGITGVRALLRLLTRFLYAKNLVAAMQLDSVHGDGSRAKAGDPSGRPKHDLAAEIAKACFENNADALYKAFSKALLKGNAYAFKELSDRAYGRLKEKIAVDVGPYRDMSNEDIEARIKELARELGVTPALPARRRPSFAKKFLILIGFRG